MKLDEILSMAGPNRRARRVGRGRGCKKGKTCGRGNNGAGQRAGRVHRLNYEGGQNPALMRIPKRGFNNANFRRAFQVVNVGELEVFDDGARVDAAALADKGLIRRDGLAVKILAAGELTKKLTVVADALSQAAERKILAAAGSVERP